MNNEEQMILLAKEGSLDAFRRLYESHWERIWHIALRYTKSGPDAEDIMQDTFIKAFKKLHTYNFHQAKTFAFWLNTIALNCSRDFLRRRKSRRHDAHLSLGDMPSDPASPLPSPDRIVEAQAEGEKIQGMLRILSPQQKLIFEMRFNQEMDIGDIAEALQCSTSNVKNQIFRSLRKLRKTLEPIWGKS